MVNIAELSKCENLVHPVIGEIVEGLGFHLVEVSFTNENQTNYLRITVMHDDHPVSTDDCAVISRSIGKNLDSSDLIPFSYVLEIQSRGVVTALLQEINEKELNHEFVLEKIGLTVRS